MRLTLTLFFCLFFVLGLSACVGKPPLQEYMLSYVAIESAQEARAKEYAKKQLHISQTLYEQALRHYNERDYKKAKEYFNQSRRYAEQAELRARVILRRKGEALL